jgi:REP element-mobilizing transposase RayT
MVYAQPGAIGLMTACTENRRSLFSTPHNADNIVEELRRLHGKSWRVLGFCVMLDHVHILVFNVEGSLLDFMRLLKGRIAHGLREDVAGAVWQRSFHDHLIRRNEDIAATLRYLLENPVRAGLARKWTKYPWSGSLQWPEIGPEFFAVNPSDVLWAEIFAL